MIALLVMTLLAQADGGTPPGTELIVYRSRAELPKELQRKVPRDFDFKKYMLAGDPGPIVEPPSISREHVATLIVFRRPQPERDCPCSGIDLPPQVFEPPQPVPGPVRTRGVLYRLPRARGPVFLVELPPDEGEALPPCPPCYAP